MKPFRLSGKPGSDEEERQLVMDIDAALQAPPQDAAQAEVEAEASPDTPTPDAAAEARESTPRSGPDDIPVQDLLSDLVGVSRRLGITPRAPSEPSADEARDVDAESAEEGDAAQPDVPEDSQPEGLSPAKYRRYALHALLLSLALAAAIVGLVAAGRLALTALPESSPVDNQTGHSRPPIVVGTVPAAPAGQEDQAEAPPVLTPDALLEPTPAATVEPAPALQPAYFLYTVQPGDAVIAIAETFAISPDYILWNNPDVIEDPNVLVVGEELLIPSVDGIIYRVKPRETLSSIAAFYHIDVESILGFAPNGLTSPNNTIAGMVLILPGAVPPLLPRPPEVVESTAPEPQPTEPAPAPEAPAAPEPQPTEPDAYGRGVFVLLHRRHLPLIPPPPQAPAARDKPRLRGHREEHSAPRGSLRHPDPGDPLQPGRQVPVPVAE